MFDGFGQYSVYRKDRGTRGGGVAAFVRKGMQVSEVPLENQYKNLARSCVLTFPETVLFELSLFIVANLC